MANDKSVEKDQNNVEDGKDPKSNNGRGKRQSKHYGKGKRGKDKKYQEHKTDENPKVKFNPVEWYTKYKVLAEEATKYGFNHIKGTAYEDALEGSSNTATPGGINDSLFAKIRFITTPGIVKDPSSGFTMQIRKLYLAMKRKYRGLNTYQVADLGITIYCIAEFYRLIAKLERIYGAFNYFNAKNRTLPKYLGEMLGVKQDNLYNNLADFRAGINRIIVRAKDLCLPKGMDVINRWLFLESNIFKDSDDPRALYYLFDDDNLFYTYQATWSSQGGSAVLSKITAARTDPNYWEYDELLDAANDVLDIMLQDDDITLQLGDIVSYYTKPDGSIDVLTLDTLPEDYVVVPTHNPDIAEQVHNASVVGANSLVTEYATRYSSITPSNFDVGARGSLAYRESSSGNGDFIFMDQFNSNPLFSLKCSNIETSGHQWLFSSKATNAKTNLKWRAGNLLLDTWKEIPSPDDIMEMTRFAVAIQYKQTAESGVTYHDFSVEACGSEIITSIFIYSTMGAGYTTAIHSMRTLNQNENADFQIMAYISKFDWRPLEYYFAAFSTTTENGSFRIGNWVNGDLDNARVLQKSDLVYIHDAAIMSLFEISSVTAFTDK